MILVTGATGNVGRQAVAQLCSAGVPVRALTRNATATFPDGVKVVHGDLRDPLDLRGVDAVFLMWPLHTAAALPGVLDAVGGRHVVYLGSGGVRDLTMAEQAALVAGCPRWTVIQSSTFAVNALWWARQLRAGDEVRGAHGDLAMAMLHEADIAAVAVRSLLDGRLGETFDITGPAALTQVEQVRVMSEVLDRPLRWVELPRAEARAQLLADGLPGSFVDVLLDVYAVMPRRPTVTATVAEVTGRPARTFAEWVTDHAAEFTRTRG
ncbi:NAD(P)H-binding protein [Actinophytocola sp.]|uniref:NmrA family NAD(P)-binding protein n=1 Tax=Actinophytocola sp. TaxID=1872138 RepID=UPI003899DEB5